MLHLLCFSLISWMLFTRSLATFTFTNPTASSVWQAGKQQTITWKDDGTSPSIATFGTDCDVQVCYGTHSQIVCSITVNAHFNPTGATSINVTPPAASGPNVPYFVRVVANKVTDPKSGYPWEAFSDNFKINGMTGKAGKPVLNNFATAGAAAAATSPAAAAAAAAAPAPAGAAGGLTSTVVVAAPSTGVNALATPSAAVTSPTAASSASTLLPAPFVVAVFALVAMFA